MQTFNTDHDAVFWTADDGEWVPAYVARGLYDALKDSRRTIQALIDDGHMGYVDFRSRIDAALAVADGEEV